MRRRKLFAGVLAACVLIGQCIHMPVSVQAAALAATDISASSGSGGNANSAAVGSDGTLWIWGSGSGALLGNGKDSTVDNSTSPVKIQSLEGVRDVELGSSIGAAIKNDNTLWTWGRSGEMGLGDGKSTYSTTPVQVNSEVKSVHLGYGHCAIIKTDGTLWMWGRNSNGELGVGSTESYVSAPAKVTVLADQVKDVAVGDMFSAAVTKDGTLYTWGYNGMYGQLGTGDTKSVAQPHKILEDVADVELSGSFGAAIKTDGSLWMWGANDCGQLGDGTTASAYTAKEIKSLTDVKAVSLGSRVSAAIKKDGSLWTWGAGTGGQLGDKTTEDNSTPHKVLDGVEQVDMADVHGIARKTDGTIYVWGENTFGQLGTGDTIQSLEPVQINLTDPTETSYSITYDLSDGSQYYGNPAAYTESKLPLTLGQPSRTGYTFAGWTGSNGTTPQTEVTIPRGTTGNLSYKANWVEALPTTSYTITYNLNGGTAVGNPTSYTAAKLPLTLNQPTRDGYRFTGWTGSNGTTPQTTVTILAGTGNNLSFTANWYKLEETSYTISYNLSGGIATGNPATYTASALPLTLNQPTRQGYTFTGWTGSNGDTPQTTVKILTGTSGNLTFTANWKQSAAETSYTITYKNTDGSVGDSNPSTYTESSLPLILRNPQKAGYTFEGWTGSNGTTPQTTVTIPKGITGDLTYTANWKAGSETTYTITYTLNGGSATGNPSSYTASSLPITLNPPVRSGYTFTGWTGSNGTTPQTTLRLTAGTSGNLTFTANWKQDLAGETVYSIVYSLDGGTVSGNPDTYTASALPFSLKNPTKAGYVFTGWTGSNGSTPQTDLKIGTGTSGTLTFVANWKQDSTSSQSSASVKTPTNLKVVCNKNGQLKVTATGASDIEGFRVTYKRGSSGNWVHVDANSSHKLKYTIKNLEKKKYKVSVAAYKTIGGQMYYSAESGTVSCKASRDPEMKKPTNLKVSCTRSGQLKVTATGKGDMTGFVVSYRLESSNRYTNKEIKVSGKKLSCTIKNLRKKKYIVRVCTYAIMDSTKYYSSWSNKVAVSAKKQ